MGEVEEGENVALGRVREDQDVRRVVYGDGGGGGRRHGSGVGLDGERGVWNEWSDFGFCGGDGGTPVNSTKWT